MSGEPSELRTAVVSIDPRSGAVRAYYGGDDGKGFDFANSGLQTGSAFKVFGLAANLDQGIPLSKMYDSSPLTVNGISISNVEGESCGICTIAEALKRSLNTSFYRMSCRWATARRRSPTWPTRQASPRSSPASARRSPSRTAPVRTMASCSASTSPG